MRGPGPLTLAPAIESFRAQFERIANDADDLAAPLSEEQFAWQPAPGSWSVAQCIDHLNMAAREYLPALDAGIGDAIRRGLYHAGPYAYNWIGRVMVWAVHPDTRIRATSPKTFRPPGGRSRREVMAAFRAYQVQYIDRLHQANGIDLARARVASPVVPLIRMPLGSTFEMVLAHERRHLQQALRVVRQIRAQEEGRST